MPPTRPKNDLIFYDCIVQESENHNQDSSIKGDTLRDFNLPTNKLKTLYCNSSEVGNKTTYMYWPNCFTLSIAFRFLLHNSPLFIAST